MPGIRIAIVGVGNCASSLVQGLSWYAAARKNSADHETLGLLHPTLGGWRVEDIEVVAAFDIDTRKVGHPWKRRSSHFRTTPRHSAASFGPAG